MLWGVNIHRRSTGSYATMPLASQLVLAASMGMKSVRVDVYDSMADTTTWLNGLNTAAGALGISVLPVVIPNILWSTTQIQAMARSLALACQWMTTVEAGNEPDLYCKKPGASGALKTDYDTVKYTKAKNAIIALYNGVKSVRPSIQVGLNMVYLDWGWLDRMKADLGGTLWDCTTWHVYLPPGSSGIAAGAPPILAQLAAYGRPVVVTEFNQDTGHLTTSDPQTLLDMMAALEAGGVSGAYVYELLDEPGLSGAEATYGLADEAGTLNELGLAVQNRLLPIG